MRIDRKTSRVIVHTFAEGMLAKLAKDLELNFPVETGNAEGTAAAGHAELTFRLDDASVVGVVKDGVVDESGISSNDRNDLLDKMRHAFAAPRGGEISVTAVVDSGRAEVSVKAPGGTQRENVRVDVSEADGELRVRGSLDLALSRLGVKPIKGPLGAFRLKDRVTVRFDIRLLATALALVVSLAAFGCGKTAPTMTPEVVDLNASDSGLATTRDPSGTAGNGTTKPGGAACPEAPKEDRTPKVQGKCTVDADCTEGRAGRCRTVYMGHGYSTNTCTYDACASDADCKSTGELCVCRASQSSRNICRPATCHTNAECGAGLACKASAPSPGDDIYVQAGPYCTTASDRCKDDASCGSGNVCAYDRAKKLWACRTPVPIPPG